MADGPQAFPCRVCGVDVEGWGRWARCAACQRKHDAVEDAFRARFPTLSERTANGIMRDWWGKTLSELLAASDDEILMLRNIGPKALAEFRAVWPTPGADVVTGDPWRDHAEMVAGVR